EVSGMGTSDVSAAKAVVKSPEANVTRSAKRANGVRGRAPSKRLVGFSTSICDEHKRDTSTDQSQRTQDSLVRWDSWFVQPLRRCRAPPVPAVGERDLYDRDTQFLTGLCLRSRHIPAGQRHFPDTQDKSLAPERGSCDARRVGIRA